MTLEIEVSAEAKAAIARCGNTGGMLSALAREMDRQNARTISHISRKQLSFPKTGPTQPHGLRHKSGRLKGAIWASAARVSGSAITSDIGDNVKYARLHEFGADFTRKGGKVRLRTDKSGALMGQKTNGRLAVFAKRSHKMAREVAFGAHPVHVPARAPFWTGIQERVPELVSALGKAATRYLKSN